ncbi:MAG: hypothetical protein ACO3JL_18680, partial [Myxococcota bacterium]
AQGEGTRLRTSLELTSALLQEAQHQLTQERARGDLFQAQLEELRAQVVVPPSKDLGAALDHRRSPAAMESRAVGRVQEPGIGDVLSDEENSAHRDALAEENAALRMQLEEREKRIRRLYQRLSVTSV